jgi:hypothetical protein
VSFAVTRVLVYDPEELVGHTRDVFVHPDDRERNAEAVEAVGTALRAPGRIGLRPSFQAEKQRAPIIVIG